MPLTRRTLLGALATLPFLGGREAEAQGTIFTPGMFGARGDGRTNDTAAFAAMSRKVNEAGGGTIVLRRTVYIVGAQAATGRADGPAFKPSDIIALEGCSRPIRIIGNKATLRAAAGLKFGRFDYRTGRPLPNAVKLTMPGNASPYRAMIHIERCSGAIEISDVELDGMVATMVIGGKSAKNGFTAGGSGIRLNLNSGPEKLLRIHSHHHAVDGLMLAAAKDRSGRTMVVDTLCDSNGRQGCSVVGGRDFVFERCRFINTGRAGLHHSPGAGVDIEAESSPIRNVAFSDCEFSNNAGFGLVSGTGDSADIQLQRCRLIGTTNWSAWPSSPGMKFEDCQFVGAINHAYGHVDPQRAALFSRCTFTDDPKLSPTGNVFVSPGSSGWIAVVLKRPNVRFDNCKFQLIGRGVLPLSDKSVIYKDCTMSQRSSKPSRPLGIYLGTNTIIGNALVNGAIVRGSLTVNGRAVPRTA